MPHAEFFLSENTDNLITALRSALYKRGIPQTLYVDNGSIYTSAEINQICSRIGTLLCHTPVRDGAAKGKIERFFRTCRDQFLLRQLDLSSIEHVLFERLDERVMGLRPREFKALIVRKPLEAKSQ